MHRSTKKLKYGGSPTPDQLEQWRINNDHREIDLLSILMVQKIIIQTETKSTAPDKEDVTKDGRVKEAIHQVKFFREYLTRMHGREVNDFVFTPTVAFPNLSTLPSPKKRSQCYCKNVNLEDRSQRNGDSDTRARYRAATMFTIEEANMNEPNRGRGAWYLDTKYVTCASTVRGEGCLFFKWGFEDGSVLQKDTAGENCLCGIKPLTVSVPQQRPGKEAKQFQVCQAQGNQRCKFFRWVNEPERDDDHKEDTNGQQDLAERKTFFKGSCEKHFMFKQHVENATERKEWWKQNCNPSTTSNVMQGETLRGRLIITSSMVFTRLPRLLSKLTPNSQLILMR